MKQRHSPHRGHEAKREVPVKCLPFLGRFPLLPSGQDGPPGSYRYPNASFYFFNFCFLFCTKLSVAHIGLLCSQRRPWSFLSAKLYVVDSPMSPVLLGHPAHVSLPFLALLAGQQSQDHGCGCPDVRCPLFYPEPRLLSWRRQASICSYL